jgi:hypothetical protein
MNQKILGQDGLQHGEVSMKCRALLLRHPDVSYQSRAMCLQLIKTTDNIEVNTLITMIMFQYSL